MSVWEDVVGQESAVAAFTAAARAARQVAEQREAQADVGLAPEAARGADSLRGGGAGSGATSPVGLAMTHAWLVTGPPGSGRSNAARAFAAALQCTGPVPGCGQCKPCRDVMAGSHPDVVRRHGVHLAHGGHQGVLLGLEAFVEAAARRGAAGPDEEARS